MKRYLLFGGDHYYPSGGANDFLESFDDLDKAKVAAEKEKNNPQFTDYKIDWYNIIDTETGETYED